MKLKFLSILLINSSIFAQQKELKHMQIPRAKKIETPLTIHNHTRIDPYFWMNQRDSRDVLDYLNAENAYAASYFEPLKPLTDELLNEFDKRIDPNETSSPFILQGKTFQYQNQKGKDYKQILVVEEGKSTVFFDENERATGKSYYDLGDWSLSVDNQKLAFSEDHVGRRNYTIFIRDEKSTKILSDQIKGTDGSIVWANDHKTIFYIKKDPKTLREFQVYRHVLGTKQTADVLVYEEKDERFSVSISKSITDAFVFISIHSSTTSEIRLISADKPSENATVFQPRKQGILYDIEHHKTGFFILTNENAPNKKVLFQANGKTQTEELVPHNDKTLIENISVLASHVLVSQRVNGLQEIVTIQLSDKKSSKISMEEETYFLSLHVNDTYDATKIYYVYNSLSTPSSVFEFDLISGEKKIFFQKKLLDKNYKSSDYQTKRIWATANDGTQIPISLIYKKGIDLVKAPLVLYGYGSYGVTIPPVFSATRISLLDRGFVYAIAHVRGGKYLGEDWYENGKFMRKINTFTDFINAADYLAMKNYCDSEKIYAIGGSAGGLLMGAVANMAPYRWKGIIAQVPFVDVVTTMLDTEIPLTVGEFEEWGNPQEEDFYWYMLSYSPYDNVKKMDYPALYITTGYHDSQVQYWEPAKWIAKLREYKTNDAPLLLDCDMSAGHGGGSGISNERLEIAKEYAFIISLEK
jgi:oligopeptidase B